MFRTSRLALAVLATAFVSSACDDSGVEPRFPTVAEVSATYLASSSTQTAEFTTTQDGETVDWLASGGILELELAADGTTSGRIFVPGMDEGGGDFDEDLAGTWDLEADTVHLDHDADTFLRDMPFQVNGDRLVGDRTFDGVRVRVVLVR